MKWRGQMLRGQRNDWYRDSGLQDGELCCSTGRHPSSLGLAPPTASPPLWGGGRGPNVGVHSSWLAGGSLQATQEPADGNRETLGI